MTKSSIIRVGWLLLAVFAAYNIYTVVNKQQTKASLETSSASLENETNQIPSDAFEGATITFNDGSTEDTPVDKRPLSLREDCTTCTETPTNLEAIFIEDPVVAECVKKEKPKSIEDLRELYCADLSVRSIEGLQYFPNLVELSVALAKDTNVDFELLPNLKSIGVSGNHHTTIDVSKNTALEGLFVSRSSNITSLDLTKNKALVQLQASDNKITSLKLPKSKALEELSIDGNMLTELDLSGYTNLRMIIAYGNKLRSLKLPRRSSLEELVVSGNELPHIGVPDSPNLTNVDLGNNPIVSFILANPNLTMLNISGTKISNFDPVGLPNLERLVASDLTFNRLNLSANKSLEVLDISGANLKALDISGNRSLSYLWVRNSNLTTLDISNNTNLESFEFSPTVLTEENIRIGQNNPNKWKSYIGRYTREHSQ